jgi:hypothetical protein
MPSDGNRSFWSGELKITTLSLPQQILSIVMMNIKVFLNV